MRTGFLLAVFFLILVVLTGCQARVIASHENGLSRGCHQLIQDTLHSYPDLQKLGRVSLPSMPWLTLSRSGLHLLQQSERPGRHSRWLVSQQLAWQKTVLVNQKAEGWQECEIEIAQYLLRPELYSSISLLGVPDSYSSWQRAFGLYPITRHFVQGGVNAYRKQATERLAKLRDPLLSGKYRHYAPVSPHEWEGADIAGYAIWKALPQLQNLEASKLVERHAPVFTVEIGSDADRLLTPIRKADGALVLTTASAQVDFGVTWVGDKALPQILYQVWFPERPKEGALDLYGGVLDGLIWRVTLSPDGREVLWYDSIHPCGCYHSLFPAQEWVKFTSVDGKGDSPVIATTFEPIFEVVIRSHDHHIVAVNSGMDSQKANTERMPLMLMQRQLESEPFLFDEKGLVPESSRLEAWLLWPMGVIDPGAMRRPGSHATAFIGERHFDDPLLFETFLTEDSLQKIKQMDIMMESL